MTNQLLTMPPLFFFFLLFLHTTTRSALSKPDPQQPDFFASCPPASCGSSPLKIRFPLRLRASSPPSCSPNGLDLTCRGNATFLSSFRVTAIDYRYGLVTVDIGSGSPCPLRNLTSLSSLIATPYYTPIYLASISLVSCSEQLVSVPVYAQVSGPVPCLSGPGYHVYVVDTSESMDVLHGDCMVVETGGEIPYALSAEYGPSFGDAVDSFERRREVVLSWDKSIPGISDKCMECEGEGRLCGFNQESNHSFCKKDGHHGAPIKAIIGASIAGLLVVVLVSGFLCYVYISRISIKEKETRLRVERFLATYTSTKPTRYTYSEVKKVTKNFRRKLGQGGFGSVYKGELPNGVPVAVKLLERSGGEAEEFINEVSAFGRMHHVNVVSLLGFCAEGSRHALLYEFMPNGSLEKFIFSGGSRSFDRLQDIAVGIARGVEYLHQGCDRRILHFDIKPHNVLLDGDLTPKISDFGLAKLCARDESMVTMTAARGTMGYIAPEVYSRNFGAVSYKSDVYSFGMVLLEMVTGRRNVDPAVQDIQSEVYFPEWLYERLVDGEDVGLGATEQEELGDVAKKLVIVAFWCIQWSPTDRPSMTRVVQLLTGSLESLQMPPKPFATSPRQHSEPSINVV